MGWSRREKKAAGIISKEKLHVLKESLASGDLIIIDNFDVDQDDDLESLFTCPCKFIITTREDFRDYDYPQLDIDRMESMDEVMQLFEAYNTCDYAGSERDAIRQILSLVDGHTMTVELIAKYLRDTRENPEDLYQRFLEKEGTVNTEEIRIKQRKDRRLRAESVNAHIRILFDVSKFSSVEEELIRSLSLLGSIRITRRKFRELCKIGSDVKELGLLIRRGWIEYNEETDKIALHQIIQDLVCQDLRPDAENCTNLVESMLQFWKADMANDSERQVRDRVFAVFMERLTGHNLLYAELCTEYGKTNYLKKAEEICRKSPDRKAMELLQEICRKKIKDAAKCEDMFESELDLDEYYRYMFREIAELLDKTMEYCKGYSDPPDYLAKTCTAIGTELDELLINEFMITANNGRIEELDRLYQMIMDILDLATRNILLADFADLDKAELLTKIRNFYTDKDIMALYRCEYFLNVEKAHWYQEQIDSLGNPPEEDEGQQIIRIDMDSMTNQDMAYIYEGKEDYDNAIRYYEKAYKDPDELEILILYDLARVCKKAGYMEQAKEHLWHILELSKGEDGYSNDACVELIRILVSEDRLEEAKELAQEILGCNSSWMQEDDCADAVRGMTEACYWLFAVEEDRQRKEGFWEKAVTYYKMLDSGESLTDDLREFVIEYTGSMKISEGWFREVQELLKRIDRYQGRKLLHGIYEQVLLICRQDGSYGEWYIHFLLMYADYLNDLENQQYAEALRYCEMAQQYYGLHHMKDAYVQNQIYYILAECMDNIKEYDFEQIQKAREKCDYPLLAQREIESNSYSDKERYEVWKQAADRYNLVDCFEKKQYCLQKAMDVLLSAFGQWGDNRYGDYWSLASGMIRCCISLEERDQAYIWIKKTYERLLDYHKVLKKEDIWSWNWWTESLADDLDDLESAEEALYMYLYILYLSITNEPDYCLVRNLCPDGETETLFYEQLEAAVKGELDNEAINQIVALKEKLLSLLEPWESRRKYAELLQWFSRHYEHHEIEFKGG